VAALYLLIVRPQTLAAQQAASTPAPADEMSNIVMSVQAVPYGTILTQEILTTVPYPKKLIVPGVFYTEISEVVGKRAKIDLDAKMPITSSLVQDQLEGSLSSFKIPDGMVAVTIPILNPIASVGYAPQPGDHVNVIATMMFVDLDASWQSILPNGMAIVTIPPGTAENPSAVAVAQSLGGAGAQGRAEQDQSLAQPIYLQPSEAQRPRLVSQTILQDVMVLDVGEASETPAVVTDQAKPTAAPNQQPTPTPVVKKPKIITLVVTPQDAVTLNYLMYSGAQMTLALRGAGDEQRVKTDAVTLQYTMDSYSIPLPAKQPYGLQPGKTELTLPAGLEDTQPAPR
jgi:pilus assembly protein CpaB